MATLSRRLQGHWNSYGVLGNSKRLWELAYDAKRLVYKWLNWRSQRTSFTWTSFAEAWEPWGIPSPRVVGNPCRMPDKASPAVWNRQPTDSQSWSKFHLRAFLRSPVR